MNRLIHSLRVALVLLMVLAAPLAHAQEEDASARFKEALEKFHARDFEGALPTLREIADVTDSPNARLYVARALREIGRLAEAYEQMQRTVREATQKAQSEQRYVGTRDAAASELAELEPRVGKLIVVLVGDSGNAAVTLDGQQVDADRIGRPMAVMPGTIHLEANAPGKAPFARDVEVAAGNVETVTVTLSDGAATPAPGGDGGSDGQSDDDDVPTEGGELRWAGIGVAGLGVVGMVMFGVGKALGDKKFDDVKAACGGVRCTDPAFADDIDAGKRYDALSTAGLVIGIAGLVGGAAMIVFGGPTEVGDRSALSLELSPMGVGVNGSF